ncbi:MAG: CcmD family protein [Thermincola sp.]|jgi:CcmD family protein|nr:CcmD family protein [Thermincola sp.]MDT3703856.1 CcmD family protein [Thermincola sp.]
MNFLFAAYMAIWSLIFGYTLLLGKRERQNREELFMLKKAIEKN